MKIIHQEGYSTDELLSWRLCVFKNLIESAKDLVKAIGIVDVQFQISYNEVRTIYIWIVYIVFDGKKVNLHAIEKNYFMIIISFGTMGMVGSYDQEWAHRGRGVDWGLL